MTERRKIEYKTINGKKCYRYEGDTMWVVRKDQ